ncbi:arrestin domain-containing protein 3-like [Physella acuta]|uniref:arrestin domain-containing protein 3-like n=1 Tax=Physella acuta TaxID=109671 RepID=UPI0027DD3487|nr:arrestin domain-containing protein 3-like [Physella acuta]
MGKLNIFEISFSNLSGVYFSGDLMQGYVTIELTESMEMRGIRLKLKGGAKVLWTESETSSDGDNSTTTTHTHSASEKYFSQTILLMGILPKQGNQTVSLPVGRHTYPFQFQLPTGLPSSFEDSIGHVRYTVKSVIDKPWKFDHKTKRPFTVISILDLNLQADCSQKLQATKSKTLCCLCCKSRPIEATFVVERKGYVPGEAIKLYAEIFNGTNRAMSKSYINLTMVKSFHATTDSKTEYKEVARLTRPSIQPRQGDAWSGEELVIPPLPPSFLHGCKIIDISYKLQLNVDPSGPALDLEIPFDIIIGTIPLLSVVQKYPPLPPPPPAWDKMYLWENTPSAPPLEHVYPAPPASSVPNLPPPSYDECITGRVNIKGSSDEYTRGNLSYCPMYPCYNWGKTASGLPEVEK